jgi:tetratricopeptide (TPR) repeat protein
MDMELLKIVGQVAGIGGIALGVLLLVFRDVVRKKIFPMLTKEQAYKLLRSALLLTCLIALAGIGAWVWVSTHIDGGVNVTVKIANELRQEFDSATALRTPPLSEGEFRRVRDLIATLTQFDPRNGHAFYYSGQMKRWLGRRAEAQQDFYKYLENEDQNPQATREGDISVEACYRSAAGYCRQRSGWICHLLANDFYQKGIAESDTDKARFYFDLAVKYAQKAQIFFPGGFEQSIPTQTVERDSRTRILMIDKAATTRTK